MITVGGYQNDMAALAKARARHARGGEPLTGAHAAAQGEMDAACAGEGHCEDGPVPSGDDAAKALGQLEAAEGPGRYMEPGAAADAGAYDRPYLDAGHSAPSPQHAPPNDFPLPQAPPAAEDFTRGHLQAGHAAASPAVRDAGMPGHQMSPMAQVHGSGPGADAIRAHMARYSSPSPSGRGGQ